MTDVKQLVRHATAGDQQAIDALMPMVYAELRRVAGRYLKRERPGQTLQATALVHEAYLRLLRDARLDFADHAHFCAIAARSMRQILVERARARGAAKRGGEVPKLALDEAAVAQPDAGVDITARASTKSPRRSR